jgi:hypothetical protein
MEERLHYLRGGGHRHSFCRCYRCRIVVMCRLRAPRDCLAYWAGAHCDAMTYVRFDWNGR